MAVEGGGRGGEEESGTAVVDAEEWAREEEKGRRQGAGAYELVRSDASAAVDMRGHSRGRCGHEGTQPPRW